MTDLLEPSTQRSSQRRLHRLKFLPTSGQLEEHGTLKMPDPDPDSKDEDARPVEDASLRTAVKVEAPPSKKRAGSLVFNSPTNTRAVPVLLRQPRAPIIFPSLPLTPTTSILQDKELTTSPLQAIDLQRIEEVEVSPTPVSALDLPSDVQLETVEQREQLASIVDSVTQELTPVPTTQAGERGEAVTAQSMQKEISGAAGNAGFVGVGNIASYFFRYGNNFLIQRGLGAGSYGVYTFSMSVISLISSLFVLGLDNAMLRYIAIYNSKKQTKLLRGLTIFCTVFVGLAGLFGALLVLSLASTVGTLVNRVTMVPILQLLAPVIPLLTLQTIWMNGLQGFKEFKKRILIARIYVPMLGFVLLILTLIFYRNLYGFVLATIATTMLTTLFSLYYLFMKVSRMKVVGPNAQEYSVGEWLGYAAPNLLTSVVEVVNASADTLLLGYFAISYVAIGQYSASIKVTGLIAMPLGALTAIFAPTIAELYSKGEIEKLDAMFKVMTKWTITFSLPIFCICTLFSRSLLGLSGDSFAPAWPLLVAFAIGAIINAGTGSVGTMLLMTGHQKLSFLNSLAAIITNFVLGVILTPLYGVMGVAISTGLALAVLNLMRLLQVVWFVKMQPYRWDMLKPLGAAAISSAITGGLLYLLALSHFSIQIFRFHMSIELALIPVFLVLYTVLLSLFKVSPEDRIVLDRLEKKLKLGKLRKKLKLA